MFHLKNNLKYENDFLQVIVTSRFHPSTNAFETIEVRLNAKRVTEIQIYKYCLGRDVCLKALLHFV
jgi:hypothetical protein